jgi:DNA-binding transcriptional ArsR family regulator
MAAEYMPEAGRSEPSPAKISDSTAELIADVMFALSAASRVQILGCLLDGPLAVGDITAMLGMEQSAVSHQLRVLREHELVRAERAGKRRVYALYDDVVSDLLAVALRHVELWRSRVREAAALAITD